MKAIKVILALALALTLVFCTVSCAEEGSEAGNANVTNDLKENVPDDSADGDKAPAQDEEQAQEPANEETIQIEGDPMAAADGFLSAFVNLRFADASKYVVDYDSFNAVISESFGSAISAETNSDEEVAAALFGDMASLGLSEDFNALLVELVGELVATMTYEITSEEAVDSENVVYTAEITMPDFEQLGTLLSEAMSNPEVEQAVYEAVEQMLTDGTITEETPEDELLAIVVELTSELVSYALVESMQSVEYETFEMNVGVTYVDGQWLVLI